VSLKIGRRRSVTTTETWSPKPLALGSWWGLLVVALTIPVLVWRILDEEKLLGSELSGYTEYTRHVRFRLVPFVW
jgi:protein-S-isoprenylcysteine O-methyltransferase Ste14